MSFESDTSASWPRPVPLAELRMESGETGAFLVRLPLRSGLARTPRVPRFSNVSHPNFLPEDLYPPRGELVGWKLRLPRGVEAEELEFLLDSDATLPADKALELFENLCGGLYALHSRGLVHGAVTPDAVVSIKGKWRLCHPLPDLGVPPAQWRFSERYLPFTAPECRGENAALGADADIFGAAATVVAAALGTVAAAEMLDKPRTRSEWEASLGQRRMPSSIVPLLAWMLVREPRGRLPSMFDAICELRALPREGVKDAGVEDDKQSGRAPRDERFPCSLQARVLEPEAGTAGKQLSAVVRNISYGGMLVEVISSDAGWRLPVRARLAVETQVPGDGKFLLAGTACWVGHRRSVAEIGVRFEDEKDILAAEEIITGMAEDETTAIPGGSVSPAK